MLLFGLLFTGLYLNNIAIIYIFLGLMIRISPEWRINLSGLRCAALCCAAHQAPREIPMVKVCRLDGLTGRRSGGQLLIIHRSNEIPGCAMMLK